MRLAVDIREAANPRRAGKGVYTLELVRELLALAPGDTFELFTDQPCDALRAPNSRVVQLSASGMRWQLLALERLARRPPDVFFAPTSYILPALLPRAIPRVVTVHDLVAFLFPERHRRKSVWIERATLGAAARSAAQLLAPSACTARDLKGQFPGLRAPISITPCAVDVERLAAAAPPDDALRARLRLPERYLLAVGTLEPRKNLLGLLAALAHAGEALHGMPLVIAGQPGWGGEDLDAHVARLGLAGRVRCTGYVSADDLARLYAGAEAFAFPSRYEGFGIPPLEAMAAGCPVVASNAASLPEVVGEAGLLVPPDDVDALARALVQLVDDRALREALRTRGRAHVRRFTWRASAEVALAALRAAASAT